MIKRSVFTLLLISIGYVSSFAQGLKSDGKVNEADVNAIVSHIMGNTPEGFCIEKADLNGDGNINVADITLLIKGGVNNKHIYTVDKNGDGDFTTISAALLGTTVGDTILVMPGIYEEHVEMYNKNRHLIGVSKESCIVRTHDGLRSHNPCNANVGSIENMTFEALIDQIPSDYYERPSIERSTYGIHIDTRYISSDRHKIIIRNCRCYSDAHSGIGIGVRYNQTIELIDCELYTTKEDFGGFLMHNDDFYPDSSGAEIILINCYIQGVNKACTIGSMYNNALCTLTFINNTCYGTSAGITDLAPMPTNHKWGNDISNSILSHGNNIAELNY